MGKSARPVNDDLVDKTLEEIRIMKLMNEFCGIKDTALPTMEISETKDNLNKGREGYYKSVAYSKRKREESRDDLSWFYMMMIPTFCG